ncbi:hypothetical protein [Saccharospirillum salsuginis]|uniref:ABM domain-containing protein n=1 Tax=Saccharospirillum salsuginis TaxID=418750 RepID=A0A918KNJ7_9GAMM|nr:hypothetical protein [Saccharospirillum salsuginis]GGX69935.1 hypothetical protein GCM10007392_41920 [Saccharospirillum salsuginis]
MGRIVIVAYRPKPGKSAELQALAKTHLSILKAEQLVTDRDSILMRAEDGTVVEVFEWRSREDIDRAHNNPVIQQMWRDYAEVCDYIPIAQVPEASGLFSEFAPL